MLDIALPFSAGLLQFALIELATKDLFGWWLINIGSIVLITYLGIQWFSRKARNDPRNAEFFDNVAPAVMRDFMPQLASAILLVLAGIVFLMVQPNDWVPIILVVLIFAGHAYFLALLNKLWARSIAPSNEVDQDVS